MKRFLLLLALLPLLAFAQPTPPTTAAVMANTSTGVLSTPTNFFSGNSIYGIGNAFTQFTGPTSSIKTFTLPNASSTLLYSGGPLGTPSSGTLTNASGLPIAGVTGWGSGVATLLAGASSGTGGPVGSITPTLTGSPVVGGVTHTSGALTGANAITSASATDLTLAGNSGASLVLGNGATGISKLGGNGDHPIWVGNYPNAGQFLYIGNSYRADYGNVLISRNLQGAPGLNTYQTISTAGSSLGGYQGIEFSNGSGGFIGVTNFYNAAEATTAGATVTPGLTMQLTGANNVLIGGTTDMASVANGLKLAPTGSGAVASSTITGGFRINDGGGNIGMGGGNIYVSGSIHSTGNGVADLLLGSGSSYNFVSLNNSTTFASTIGIFGGASGDSRLYLNAPTGGTINARINNVDQITVSSTATTLAGNLVVSGTGTIHSNGSLNLDTAGGTVVVKSGTNALSGTVTLVAGSGTITSTAIDANTVIIFSEKTAGGTPGLYQPLAAVTSGSATVTSVGTDTSTYNWVALKLQ